MSTVPKNGRKRPTWADYYFQLATVCASRSQDPYPNRAVGCIAVRPDKSIASLGYNGPPPHTEIDWRDRDERRLKILHAEINCCRFLKPGECDLIVVTLQPCSSCLCLIASYGIKKIIFGDIYDHDKSSLKIAKEFNISLLKYSPGMII